MCCTPYIFPNKKILHVKEYSTIVAPCGKCYECLTQKSWEWSFRLYQENRVSSSAYFVTLTYNNDNLVFNGDGDPTLYKPDLQNYIKRLRKLNTDQIRYFGVGEYGGRFKRPHYHIILFNARKKTIERAWNTPTQERGIVDIGDVSMQSIRYVTSYIVGKNKYSDVEDIQKPFQLMSKGLGINYCSNEQIIKFHNDNLANYVVYEGKKMRMPRYFKNLIFPDYKKRMIFENSQKHLGSYIKENHIEKIRQNERNLFKQTLKK